MNLAPIVLFVYNRPQHVKLCVEALAKNKQAPQSDLIIYADDAKNEAARQGVADTRAYIKNITGFKSVTIIERSKNIGLAGNVMDGVTHTVNNFGQVIVLEDDLEVSPFFLQYMNSALEKYQHEETVISIHGYIYPVTEALPETFFLRGADCWGWATWKRGWDLFEPDGKKLLQGLQRHKLVKAFNYNHSYNYVKMLKQQIAGKNSSWAVRWYASAFLLNKLTLYPGKSLVQNIGTDGAGTHVGKTELYRVSVSPVPININPGPVVHSEKAYAAVQHFFRQKHGGFLARILMKIKSNLPV